MLDEVLRAAGSIEWADDKAEALREIGAAWITMLPDPSRQLAKVLPLITTRLPSHVSVLLQSAVFHHNEHALHYLLPHVAHHVAAAWSACAALASFYPEQASGIYEALEPFMQTPT